MSPRMLPWMVWCAGCAGIVGCDALEAVVKPEPAPIRLPVQRPIAVESRPAEVVEEAVATPQEPKPEPEPQPAGPVRQEIVIGFDTFTAGPLLVKRRPAMAFAAKYIVYKGDLNVPLKFVWEIRDGRNNVLRIPVELSEGHGELLHVEPGVRAQAGPFNSRIVCSQEVDEGDFKEVCPWHLAPQ